MEVSPETLALDTINAVGPAGHFLAQKHTRKYMKYAMQRAITHQVGPNGKYRDPHEVACEKLDWILKNHQPELLEEAKRDELTRILAAADREMN